MKPKNQQRFWRIQIYDSMKEIYKCKIKQSEISSNGINRAIELLVARYLEPSEIIDSCKSKRYKPASHLDITHSMGKLSTLTCGSNPHVKVDIVDENDKLIPIPK